MDHSGNSGETEGSIDSEAVFEDPQVTLDRKLKELKETRLSPIKKSKVQEPSTTREDVDRMKKQLEEALDYETKLVERQVELHEQTRDLKIAIEKAETKKHMAALEAQKEKILAAKEAAR